MHQLDLFEQGLPDFLRLWFHESRRVYADRLVNDEDRSWFTNLLKDRMKVDFGVDIKQVVFTEHVLYCDFATDNYEARPYVEVKDIAAVGFLSYLLCYSIFNDIKCMHIYAIFIFTSA